MLWSFSFMISGFAWQMVALPVDHSLQSKQCTALPALSRCTSCSFLASFIQPLVIKSLEVSAVHLTFQTLISLIIHLTSTYLAWVVYSCEVIINLSFSLFIPFWQSQLSSIFCFFFFIHPKNFCKNSLSSSQVILSTYLSCVLPAHLISFWSLIKDLLSS